MVHKRVCRKTLQILNMEKLNKANQLAERIEKTKQEIAMYEKALETVKHSGFDMSDAVFKPIAEWLCMSVPDAINAMQDGISSDLTITKEYLKKYETELNDMFK